MKKMSKAGFAAAFIMTMSFVFGPVYAAENNSKVSTTEFKTILKDKKATKEVVGKIFDKDLKEYDAKHEKDQIVYTSDDFKIEVKGLNIKKPGVQKVSMIMSKNSNLENLGVPEMIRALVDGPKVEKEVSIDVVDKKAPKIEASDRITTDLNQKIDLNKVAKVTDDHKVKSVKLRGDIDYSRSGKYGVQIVATDQAGNESKKDVTVVVGNMNQVIADAALAQLGVYQDCTMLVTNSLRAVGINFHGAPEQYLSLGELTNNPVPGDICVYAGHVALYVGNGQAVHGGWLGNQTVLTTVACDRPFIGYVHIEL